MKTKNIMPEFNLSNEEMLKQASASLAIEDMYIDDEFRNKMDKFLQGKKSTTDILNELDEKYGR